MFFGALPVSDVGGNPCADGFAEVESGTSGLDIALSAGIFLLETALVGFMALSEADPVVYGTVGGLALILTPSSRTTTYRCSGRLFVPPVVPSPPPQDEVDYDWDDDDGSFR